MDSLASPHPSVAVLGLGFVGLPLALRLSSIGVSVLAIETNPLRLASLCGGSSYLSDVSDEEVQAAMPSGNLHLRGGIEDVGVVQVIHLCVPTPIDASGTPDLTDLDRCLDQIGPCLRSGQTVILHSTVAPGTTDRVASTLEKAAGLQVGRSLFVAHSPERANPGASTERWSIPRLVGGVTDICLRQAMTALGAAFSELCPVSSAKVSELSKLHENSFRAMNIALAEELRRLCVQCGIPAAEVIDAAATKPYGFMPFWPRLGVGGHCIAVDPYFLTSFAAEQGAPMRLLEAALDINRSTPEYLAGHTQRLLAERFANLKSLRILALGVAYKPNVADFRESPALAMLKWLSPAVQSIAISDPFLSPLRELEGLPAHINVLEWNGWREEDYDIALVLCEHDNLSDVRFQSIESMRIYGGS